MLDTIVYDVDGVLLDWVAGFKAYARTLRYRMVESSSYDLIDWFPGLTRPQVGRLVEDFNRSEDFSRLPDIPGAATAVRHLKATLPNTRHIAVSACGVHPQTVYYRSKQLANWGFDELHNLPLHQSKFSHFYRPQEKTLVIEDNPKYLDEARFNAHCWAICFAHPWNKGWEGLRFDNWEDICDHILTSTE